MKKWQRTLAVWIQKNILSTKLPYLTAYTLETAKWDYTYKNYRKKYQIHPTFRFNGEGIILQGLGKIILGKNGYIGRNSIIESTKGCMVKIGDYCMIGPSVSIRSVSRNPTKHEERTYGNITIGNNVWLGTSAFIREDIQIGDNAVIGANSVVTKNIPSNVLACGCPAKIKKEIAILYEMRDATLKALG